MSTRRAYGSRLKGARQANFNCQDDVCVPVKDAKPKLRSAKSLSMKEKEVSADTLTKLREIMNSSKRHTVYPIEGTTDAIVCPEDEKDLASEKCSKRVPKRLVDEEGAILQRQREETKREEKEYLDFIARPTAPVNEYSVAFHLRTSANTQIRMLTKTVGESMFKEDGLFSNFETLDVKARFPEKDKEVVGVTDPEKFTLEQYVDYAAKQVQDWEAEDERRLLGWFQKINDALVKGGMVIKLMAKQINIIKTTGKQEPVSKGEPTKRIRGYLLGDDTIVLCWECLATSSDDQVMNLLLDLIAQMMIREGDKARRFMLSKLGVDTMGKDAYLDIINEDYDLETRFMLLPSDWPVVDYVPVLKLDENETKIMLGKFPQSVRDAWSQDTGRWMVVTLAASGASTAQPLLSQLAEYEEKSNPNKVTFIVEPKGTIYPYRFVVPVKKGPSGYEEIKKEDSEPVPLTPALQKLLPQARIGLALQQIVRDTTSGKSLEKDKNTDATNLRELLVSDKPKLEIKTSASAAVLPTGEEFKKMKIVSGRGREQKKSA